MSNFTINGQIENGKANAAYDELYSLVMNRDYNRGELVLEKW